MSSDANAVRKAMSELILGRSNIVMSSDSRGAAAAAAALGHKNGSAAAAATASTGGSGGAGSSFLLVGLGAVLALWTGTRAYRLRKAEETNTAKRTTAHQGDGASNRPRLRDGSQLPPPQSRQQQQQQQRRAATPAQTDEEVAAKLYQRVTLPERRQSQHEEDNECTPSAVLSLVTTTIGQHPLAVSAVRQDEKLRTLVVKGRHAKYLRLLSATEQSCYIKLDRALSAYSFRAIHRESGKMYCLKELHHGNKSDLLREPAFRAFLREAEILTHVRHPHVVSVRSVELISQHQEQHSASSPLGAKTRTPSHHVDNDSSAAQRNRDDDDDDDDDDKGDEQQQQFPQQTLRIIFDHAACKTTLANVLEMCGACNEHRLQSYAKQLLSGLDALHQKRIVLAGCINPALILVDEQGRLLLSLDYNISSSEPNDVSATSVRSVIAAALPFLSPEARQQGVFGAAGDVYSVAAVLAYCSGGAVGGSDPPQVAAGLSSAGIRFFVKALAANPAERGTAQELLADPWLTTN